MTENELPTEKDLLKLSRRGMVCYALRCAMRVADLTKPYPDLHKKVQACLKAAENICVADTNAAGKAAGRAAADAAHAAHVAHADAAAHAAHALTPSEPPLTPPPEPPPEPPPTPMPPPYLITKNFSNEQVIKQANLVIRLIPVKTGRWGRLGVLLIHCMNYFKTIKWMTQMLNQF